MLTAGLLLYGFGYVVCRLNKSIVHYTASVDGKCTWHEVDAGDAKLGSPVGSIAAVYTPLRFIERTVWRIAKPLGSAC